jgi:hypothetical protein
LVASYPKFIRSFQGIPFLTCWIAASESDRKHCSAVADRTLSEREHVDKQIFEILELAERAQVPMDVNVNRVADLASNFARYLIQRKFMKVRVSLIERCKIGWAAGRRVLNRTA